MARPSRRDDVLQAAAARFYRDGIAATGVDTLIADAGVAKMTLYGNFGSKDELVVAYLRQRDERFFERLEDEVARRSSPTERALAPLELYRRALDEEGFHGCAFVNAAAELPADHPAHRVITEHKARLLRRWAELIAELPVEDAHQLAVECFLLMEGAFVQAGLGVGPGLFDQAEERIRDRLARTAARGR